MGIFGDFFGGLGNLGGNLANLMGAAGEGGKGSLKKSYGLWEKIQEPDFDYRDLTFPELQQLAEYSPEMVKAVVPADVLQVLDSPEMRGQQVGALGQLNAISGQGGLALEDRLAVQDAQRAMASENSRAQGAVMRNLAQRGALGGGDEIQARLLANQGASEAGRGLMSDITRQAMARRLGAIQSGAGLAGQIRGQDVERSGQNASIMNRFNELAAQIQNQASQFNTQNRNQAQAANTAEKQRLGEANLMGRYNTQAGNLERQNALRQQSFGNKLQKTAGMTGALGDLANAQYAEQAAKAQTIRSLGQSGGQMFGGVGDLYGSQGWFGDDLKATYKRK